MRRGTPKIALYLALPEHEYNHLQRMKSDTSRTMVDLATEALRDLSVKIRREQEEEAAAGGLQL